jgi:recombinational DNA repair protein (RecF pathway)
MKFRECCLCGTVLDVRYAVKLPYWDNRTICATCTEEEGSEERENRSLESKYSRGL